MSWAIRVENLSKLYRVGSSTASTETLYRKIAKGLRFKRSKSCIDNISESSLAHSENHIISPSQIENVPEGHFWALKDVSFEINQGDRVGIIGQNGSGKSTLLKILSRITAPTQGLFRYRGRLISLLEVGTGFHTELSGRDNIYLNAALNGMSNKEITARFNEIVEFSELGEQIYTPVKRYSSGMYMRLAFSIAAHLESEILLVDEVLAVGDVGFQKKCKDKMLEVTDGGRTLLFVSHDIAAVQNVCNKAIELSHGQLLVRRKPLECELPQPELISSIETDMTAAVLDVGVVTAEYMQSKFVTQAERIWDEESAPSIQDSVYVFAVRLLDEEGQIRNEFDVKESIIVEIELIVAELDWPLNVHIYVTSLSGERLFVSMDNLDLPEPESVRPAGRYIERCRITAPFLNDGVFRVEVFVCSSGIGKHHVSIPDAVSFIITDDMSPKGVRGNWKRECFNYSLRPRLHWQINYLPEVDNKRSKKFGSQKEVLVEPL